MLFCSCQVDDGSETNFYARRKEAAKITDFPIDAMERLFVNENLTQSRKKLFWLANNQLKDLNTNLIGPTMNMYF